MSGLAALPLGMSGPQSISGLAALPLECLFASQYLWACCSSPRSVSGPRSISGLTARPLRVSLRLGVYLGSLLFLSECL